MQIPPVPPLQLGLGVGGVGPGDSEFLLRSAADAESLSSRNRRMGEARSEKRREEEESLIRMGSPRAESGNVLGVRNIDARKTKKEVNELIWKQQMKLKGVRRVGEKENNFLKGIGRLSKGENAAKGKGASGHPSLIRISIE